MKSIIRTASRSLCVPFFWTLLVAGAWNFSAAQVLEPDGRAARFPKIDMRGAHAAAARLASSTGPDFYDEYIKGKRVLINFFYTRCDRGVCNQLMNNLVQVQRLLGDRLGQDVFICSITLDPEHDTPDVLQAYANKLGAKPGWSFLRGSVQDTTALREKLGLADLPPEVARRLDAVSPQVAASGKSIEATAANVWQPKSLRALEDDRIVWKLSDGTPGEHGLQITNWEMVKQFVEVEPVEGQQPFNATTGKNDLPTETAGKVLLRLKLNTAPPVPTRITYDCIVHGTTMSGEVSLGQRHTGMLYVFDDPANHHSLVSVDATPTEILEALGRLRSLTISAPSGGSAALPEITIDAGPGVAWMSGGNASTPTTPLKVTAQKGQTLVFRHNDPNLRHGIVFLTENLVLLKGDDPASKPGAVLKQTDDLGLYNKKVSPGPTPKELARFEVIQDITTAPAFQCTVHLGDMAGTVNKGSAARSAALPEITIDAGPDIKWTSGGNSSTPDVPLTVNAQKGQTLVFRHNDPVIRHGIVFTTPNLVLLKGDDPATKPGAVLKQTDDLGLYNKKVSPGPTPKELARFEVIQDITTAPAFECTVHHQDMAGTVEKAPASRASRSTGPPEITIDAGPGVAWMSGGNASTPTTPLKVTAQKGQTLVFRHNDPNLRHGIVFLTENLVLLKGDDPASKPGAVLQQTDDLGLYNKKVSPGPTPKELARFEVIQDIGTAPAFECTVHLADMAGSVNAPGITMGAGAGNLETALTTMSPSMQRRILRFVNRANRPEDLMKSPQEFRTSEHVPPGAHKSSPDAKVGFARVMAEALIKGRPLYGYRDVRECLPIYKSSGKPEDLSKVLESAGPSRFGKWDEVGGETPSVMHAAMLHTGKVLLITDSTDTAFWDPAGSPQVLSGSVTGLADILYCSGHSFLSDGRLLAVGGGGSDPGAGSSIHGWKFDTASSKWSRTSADMAVRRWYPTLVTLGDEPGRILVAAGLTSRVGTPAPHMEVYSETTDSFETITATGPAGELLFRPTYPGLHLLPGGEIFHAPTGFNDCNQAPITSGDVADPTAIFRFASDVSGSWTTLAANNRLKGMSVLLFNSTPPFIQGLVAGGGEAPKNGTAQAIDLSSVSPAWSPTFPLLEARVHPNLVVLPDGTVFICGGKVASANPPPNGGRCELYDPKTGLTSEMDELIVPRHYHSVALLLPDARVMMAGGADDAGCTISTQKTIEVFSPPYLFRGSRPLITSAANFVEHGATIEIKTPAASEIQRVVLARPAAVTHQTDSEQRVLPLSFQVTGPDMIEAKAPGGTGANPIAPRGHYMLFILNQQGVPSVSKWVFVR